MKWFKFYGQDFFTDPKVMQFSDAEKLIYIGLLTLAGAADTEDTQSDDHHAGMFDFVTVERVMGMVGIDSGSQDWTEALDFYDRLEELNMIEVPENARKIIIKNYKKRQNTYLSDAERSKKYRDKNKRDVRHVVKSDERHARIDKKRIDNKTIAAEAAEVPFNQKETRQNWYDGDDSRFQLLAWFFDKKTLWPKLDSKEKVRHAVTRHLRSAQRIDKAGWTQKDLTVALQKIPEKMQQEYTLETLEKYLTK